MSARAYQYIGTRPIRHDGVDKVTGRASYGADLAMPGMLRGAVLRSPHAHARIVSIDTGPAEAVPGVKAVLTGRDLPECVAPGAPLRRGGLLAGGAAPDAATPGNVAARIELRRGDVERGFAEADVVVEREFRTSMVHQGYIEPHACVARAGQDGQAVVWTTTQGPFLVREQCAAILGMDAAKIKVTPSEIGGGFGGKVVVDLEPLALALARPANRPGP